LVDDELPATPILCAGLAALLVDDGAEILRAFEATTGNDEISSMAFSTPARRNLLVTVFLLMPSVRATPRSEVPRATSRSIASSSSGLRSL